MLTVSIYRYHPELDAKPYMQDFQIDTGGKDLMVLDVLNLLKIQDRGLAYRRSCREGVCGSDGMNINGTNGLACITPLSKVVKNDKLTLRPLPALPVIRDLVIDMDQFYKQELVERKKFKYPPFYRLIKIIIKGKDKNSANQAAIALNIMLQKSLTEKRVLGPIEPVINKIRNYYLFEIIIKIERKTANLKSIKEFIQGSRHTLLALPSFKSILIHFDVDPI